MTDILLKNAVCSDEKKLAIKLLNDQGLEYSICAMHFSLQDEYSKSAVIFCLQNPV